MEGNSNTRYKAKHGFLSSLAEWVQKFKYLYTAGSWQDSTKAFLNPLDFIRSNDQLNYFNY